MAGDARGRHELAYDNHGSGRPLVFLHGGWTDRRLFAPQVSHFAADYRTISVDLRDHGDSERAEESYSIREMAADVAGLLADLEADAPVVCGLSLGGLVAQRLPEVYPGRLSGLVLADTVTSIPPVELPAAAKRMLFPRAGVHAAVRTMGASAYYRLLLSWVETIECRRWLTTCEDAREYALGVVDSFDTDRFLRVFDALYGFEPVEHVSHDTPALVVHGDHEAAPVVRQNRTLADRLSADRVVVPDAGHLSNRDNPGRFNAALERFLNEQGVAGA